MNNNELYKDPFDDLSIVQNIQVQIVNESDELQNIDNTLNTYIINNLRFNLIDKKNKLESSINHLVEERDYHLNKSLSSALDIFDNEVDNNTISCESLGYKALTSIASFIITHQIAFQNSIEVQVKLTKILSKGISKEIQNVLNLLNQHQKEW